ncbi:MAG TPA: hypothetical protein VFZ77_19305 [Acidimicrobiales bacterium]
MTDLHDRLNRLARAGAAGVDLHDPAHGPRGRPRRHVVAAAAVAGVVAAVAIGAAVLAGDGGGGDRTVTGPAGQDGPGAAVAVTLDEATILGVLDPDTGEGPHVLLRFRERDGTLLATEQLPLAGAEPPAVVVHLPAGEVELEATPVNAGGPPACTQAFTAGAGEGLIVRLGGDGAGAAAPGGDAPCTTVQTVEEWVRGRTGPAGAPYVGLAVAEAEERAAADGLTTRVVGQDGVDLVITMDLRPDRLDLVVFDGVVVAAQLGGEAPMADQPALPPLGDPG